MELIFLAMKSVTGWILDGSAQPTHVTPVMGKARSWRRRTTLELTEMPSSLASDAHATRPLTIPPPNAAPAMSMLAELSASSSPSSSSPSSSSSSYSRGRFLNFARAIAPCRRLLDPLSPRTLAVLEPPSRSQRPRISSSIIEIGPYMASGFPLLALRPAAAAHTGCCAGAAPACAPATPAACGRCAASTASPCGSGGTDPSSLSDIFSAPLFLIRDPRYETYTFSDKGVVRRATPTAMPPPAVVSFATPCHPSRHNTFLRPTGPASSSASRRRRRRVPCSGVDMNSRDQSRAEARARARRERRATTRRATPRWVVVVEAAAATVAVTGACQRCPATARQVGAGRTRCWCRRADERAATPSPPAHAPRKGPAHTRADALGLCSLPL